MSFANGFIFETSELNKNTELAQNPLNTDVSNFEIINELGSGSYGIVYNVKHSQTELKYTFLV